MLGKGQTMEGYSLGTDGVKDAYVKIHIQETQWERENSQGRLKV